MRKATRYYIGAKWKVVFRSVMEVSKEWFRAPKASNIGDADIC